MARSVSATQAKIRFGEILAEVAYGHQHVMITKHGKGVAVLIPIKDYEEYLRLKKEYSLPPPEQ